MHIFYPHFFYKRLTLNTPKYRLKYHEREMFKGITTRRCIAWSIPPPSPPSPPPPPPPLCLFF